MEDYVILLSIAMFGVFALMGMKLFRGETKPKSSTSKAKDTLAIVNKDTIDRLSVELRKAHGRANRLQYLRDGETAEEEELLTEGGKKPVTWEEITTLVNQTYPQYAKFLPLMKNQIIDATKDMSMEEVLQYVKQFTGNKQSQGSPLPQTDAAGYNSNWA